MPDHTDPNVREFDMELPTPLTDAEIAAYAGEAGEMLGERDQVERQKKAAAESYAGRMKALDAKIRHRLGLVQKREEERPVRVRQQPDYNAGVISTVRIDTGEEVARRGITPQERQLRLHQIGGETSEERDGIDRQPAGS